MKNVLLKHGVDLCDQKIEALSLFCDFLLEKNRELNLTAIRKREEVYSKHFADSLIALNKFESNKRILEVGSGGGFPSMPLKLANGDLDFTLLEATGKKCEFLKGCKQKFGLDKFEVINARAEELAKNKDYRESFDIVTARAVASLNVLLELTVPFLKVGGKCVFYKLNSPEELKEAQNALKCLSCTVESIDNYAIDGVLGERSIITVVKSKPTDDKYPREYKRIIKKPL